MSDNDLRYDALKELFNISVGKAASMLSEMINSKIILDVPYVDIIHVVSEELKIENYLPKVLEGALMVSSISFKEQLTGQANLIFPADKMKTFINVCINNEDPNTEIDMDFTDVDYDIIKEIGNIILNSIIGEISNYINIKLNYSLPEVKIFDRIDFAKDIKSKENTHILMLYITFNIDNVKIDGAIIIDLTINSLNEIINKIDMMVDDLYG
ncbi:chemotaxis protein CheC [Clostridium sp. MSJ-11]|uniref:Chemotaxis protein CheC n=1 Tax=Clostridium mobile TaxID=2841512 RepID=A0ABS6EJ16_9CLOT|nr:chemotaxis protein CheC [Clostridium mobile]MBU5484676.1 chemotaxis protein CheC [Clostridium mobile]